MNWVDAGVNLLDKRFTLADLFSRAIDANVTQLLAIASDIAESQALLSFIKQHATNVDSTCASNAIQITSTAGVHPHYADACTSETWTKLASIIADKSIVAIGECGLDFNRNFSTPKNQLYAFEKQLDIAARHNMGVYLHEREAFEPQVKLLEQYSDSLRFMVTHCFTGKTDHLQEYVKLGCYVGITGWLCDPKRGQDLKDAVKHLPLSRLLLETDSPYLFPKTLKPRKSINEPCNIPFIADAFSEHTGHKLEKIKEASHTNANALFFQAGAKL